MQKISDVLMTYILKEGNRALACNSELGKDEMIRFLNIPFLLNLVPNTRYIIFNLNYGNY